MLTKPQAEIVVPGEPGHPGQQATSLCPPPPLPPGPPPSAPPDSGGGGCRPGAGQCCSIVMLPNQYGILVPTLVCE